MLLAVGVPACVLLLSALLLALPLVLATPTPGIGWIPHAYNALSPILIVGLIAMLTLVAALVVMRRIDRDS